MSTHENTKTCAIYYCICTPNETIYSYPTILIAIRQGEFHINVQENAFGTMWLRTYMYLLQALYFYELFNKEQDIFFF